MQPQPQQLDKDVVNAAKAIRQVESGNNAVTPREGSQLGGASRYQYTHDTWRGVAGKYLGDQNAPLTLENENKATYLRIKDWKDQGYNIGQIASMWNAGEGRPNAYMENHRGVNEYGVAYDTPGYAKKVAEAYQQIKNSSFGGNYAPPPTPPQFNPADTSGYNTLQNQVGSKQGGFFSDVGETLTGVGAGIDEAALKVANKDINVASGFLQGAGAIAGGVGGVIDDTLSNLPVVGGLYQGATDIISGAVQGAMNTEPGQKAQAWAQEHPEAAGNIGAAVDIASLFPFFKALKTGKTGLQDVRTAATLKSTQESAVKELEASLNKPQRRILERSNARGQDAMGLIVKNQEYLPDVIEKNGRYYFDTAESTKALQRSIDADEKALQNLLESTMAQSPEARGIAFNINDVAKQTMDDVLDSIGRTGGYDSIKDAVTRYFDSYKRSMNGVEFINLSELNDIKRDVRKAINFDAIDPTGTLAKEAQMSAGQSLMKQVEDAAEKAGIKGVADINKRMGEGLTAMKLLEHLGDGKAIKSGPPGLVKSLSKETPIVSGLVDYATKGAPSTPTTRLKRKRPLRETGRQGLVQLGTGLALSGQLTSTPQQ